MLCVFRTLSSSFRTGCSGPKTIRYEPNIVPKTSELGDVAVRSFFNSGTTSIRANGKFFSEKGKTYSEIF